jgi:hypothetical protein
MRLRYTPLLYREGERIFRQLAAKLGLAVGAVLVTLIGAELGARLLVPDWAPTQAERNFWAYDPVLGWAHRPGQRGGFSHRDFSVSVSINSYGLRDREYPLERVPGKRRMLVLGDSFTWGFGVEQDEAFSEILERRHPDWEIINAGVSGYGTDQQLLWLERRGIAFQPDVVLLAFHEGDIKDNNLQVRYGYRKSGFVLEDGRLSLVGVPVEPASARERFDRFLFHNTWLFHRLNILPRILRAALAERRDEEEPETPAVRSTPEKPDPTRDYRVTARLLERLHAAVEAAGARLVVMSIPMGHPDLPLVETLERIGVPHLGLKPALRAAEGPIRFEHDMHWTPEGHRVVANALEIFLVEIGIFERRGPESSEARSSMLGNGAGRAPRSG